MRSRNKGSWREDRSDIGSAALGSVGGKDCSVVERPANVYPSLTIDPIRAAYIYIYRKVFVLDCIFDVNLRCIQNVWYFPFLFVFLMLFSSSSLFCFSCVTV